MAEHCKGAVAQRPWGGNAFAVSQKQKKKVRVAVEGDGQQGSHPEGFTGLLWG